MGATSPRYFDSRGGWHIFNTASAVVSEAWCSLLAPIRRLATIGMEGGWSRMEISIAGSPTPGNPGLESLSSTFECSPSGLTLDNPVAVSFRLETSRPANTQAMVFLTGSEDRMRPRLARGGDHVTVWQQSLEVHSRIRRPFLEPCQPSLPIIPM